MPNSRGCSLDVVFAGRKTIFILLNFVLVGVVSWTLIEVTFN